MQKKSRPIGGKGHVALRILSGVGRHFEPALNQAGLTPLSEGAVCVKLQAVPPGLPGGLRSG